MMGFGRNVSAVELFDELKQTQAERNRYRLAWDSARRRAWTRTFMWDVARTMQREYRESRDANRAALQRVRDQLADWAERECVAGNRWEDIDGYQHYVACFHCAAAEMTRTLDGEGTDGR